MATPPKKPAKAPATPRKAAAPTKTSATVKTKIDPFKGMESPNVFLNLAAKTPEQAAQAIDQALQGKLGNVAEHKAKKAASKVHNDVEKGSKAGKKGTSKRGSDTQNQPESVKSGEKTTKAIARAREGKQKWVAIDEPMIQKILAEVSGGKSLYKVCRGDDMPDRVAVLEKFNASPELRARWVAAMEARADKYAEETIDIADDGSNDTYVDADGNVKTDHDVIARSKLRIDARKWYAGKLAPKYNDKVDVNHGVQPGNPIVDLLAQLAGTGLKPVA